MFKQIFWVKTLVSCIGFALAILHHASAIWKLSEDKQLHKKTQVQENKILETHEFPQHFRQDFPGHCPYGLLSSSFALQQTPLWETWVTQWSRCVHRSHKPGLDQAWPAEPDIRGLLGIDDLFIRVTAMDGGSNAGKRMMIPLSSGVLWRTASHYKHWCS